MDENQETHQMTQEEDTKSSALPQSLYMVGAVVAVIIVVGIVFALKSMGNKSTLPDADDRTLGSEDMRESGSESQDSSKSADTTIDPSATQIQLEAGSFYYKPNVLTVKKGVKVQIVMKSIDMMHDFNIDELNVHSTVLKSGKSEIIEFTPEKAGTFEYYCSVGQHRKNGQVGKITVTE